MLWSEIQEGRQNSCICRVWSCSSKIHKLMHGRMKHLIKWTLGFVIKPLKAVMLQWFGAVLQQYDSKLTRRLPSLEDLNTNHQETSIYSSTKGISVNQKARGNSWAHCKWMRQDNSHLSVQPILVSFQHMCMFRSEKMSIVKPSEGN